MSALSYRNRGDWFVVGFNTDRLTDAAAIQSIQQSLFAQLERLPFRGQVAVTFEGVEHASSQLVSLLLGAKRIVEDRFGKLVLCRVGQHLRQVLSITRLDSQFEIRERLRDVTGSNVNSGELVRTATGEELQWLH